MTSFNYKKTKLWLIACREMGTLLKSKRPKGAVRMSLRAKLVRVFPKSVRSDTELAALQSTRNAPSTATVRRKRAA